MDEALTKIKEDAVKMQEADIADTVKAIESEHLKSSLVIGFAATILGVTLDKLESIPLTGLTIFILLVLASIGTALYNLSAKKIKLHSNVDKFFDDSNPAQTKEWEVYLKFKHDHLKENYKDAKDLLYDKAKLTRYSFIFLILSILFLIVFKYSYGYQATRGFSATDRCSNITYRHANHCTNHEQRFWSGQWQTIQ